MPLGRQERWALPGCAEARNAAGGRTRGPGARFARIPGREARCAVAGLLLVRPGSAQASGLVRWRRLVPTGRSR